MKKEYRNSARTKKMIRSALMELIPEKRSLSNITVSELSERADIAKSTFYNHYEDIYAVADDILGELLERINSVIDEMEADNTTDYRIYLKKIFELLRQNEQLYHRLVSANDARIFIDMIKAILVKRVFAKSRLLPSTLSPGERQVYIRFIANACVETMVDYFRGEIDIEFDELEEYILTSLDKMK